MTTKTIAITLGDPAGIGPEIALKAAAEMRPAAIQKAIMRGV